MKKFFDRFRRKTNNEYVEASLQKAHNDVQALELALHGIAKMSRESKIDKVRHNWIQKQVASALNRDTTWTTVKKPTKRG
jgi:hypothetical protein